MSEDKNTMAYDDVLKKSCSGFKDDPVMIAFLDKNKLPFLSFGKFNLNDLTFMKHLIDKQISHIIDQSIKLE
jgi:hypothetical protein